MHPHVENKHLVRRTTYRAYHEGRLGSLEELPVAMRDPLLEEERYINQRMQPGDELWEWEMTTDELGMCSGLALLRDGKILIRRMCYRLVPSNQAAPPGMTTAINFYENGTRAAPGSLQRSIGQMLIRTEKDKEGIAKTLLLDPNAETTAIDKPAFMAAPEGAPEYHGFPLLEETRTDGWCLGAMSDPFEADSPEGCTIGSLFVEAPDGRRAGIVWTINAEPQLVLLEVPTAKKWGVYHFTFQKPIREMKDLQEAFAGILPKLKTLHWGYMQMQSMMKK